MPTEKQAGAISTWNTPKKNKESSWTSRKMRKPAMGQRAWLKVSGRGWEQWVGLRAGAGLRSSGWGWVAVGVAEGQWMGPIRRGRTQVE